jgi:hypothetical protein
MTIPSTVEQTANGYIKYLESQINKAREHWTHYGWAVSAAYASAYQLQLNKLQQVKKMQEARRLAEHAFVNFCFSLLTVGVAGGVAGALARKMFTDAAGKKNEVAIDAMKQVLQRGQQQRAYDPVMEALNPPTKVADDIFAPVGPTPEEYTTKLQEGISQKTTLLQDILDEVQWNRAAAGVTFDDTVITLKSSGDKLTVADAKYLTEAILNSSFMKDLPPSEVNSAALTPKASLALWIGWAYARDAKYWSAARIQIPIIGPQTEAEAYKEQFEWEPVRLALVGLGVPAPQITVGGIDYGWMGRQSPINGLWMWGFMKWAASSMAADKLFSGLQINAKGFEEVRIQMSKRKLTENGWIGL